MLSLDHQSPVPLRAQVESLLRELIRQPEYQKGGLIPDEVALAAKLGVSRGTVRSGISKLVFEGVLERKAGVGTRISSRNVESGIPRLGAVSPAKWLPRASRLKIFNKVLIA